MSYLSSNMSETGNIEEQDKTQVKFNQEYLDRAIFYWLCLNMMEGSREFVLTY